MVTRVIQDGNGQTLIENALHSLGVETPYKELQC